MGKKVKIKLDTGTVYQTEEGGTYYFRYQVMKERKCVSLKTHNQEEALQKAKELQGVINATSIEVISAHVKVARKLAKQTHSLPLSQAWDVYASHPQRATPATVHEQLSYESTFREFLEFLNGRISNLGDVTAAHVIEFAEYLKKSAISVSTHNRKLVRLRKIFSTLNEYCTCDNPFAIKSLRRKDREEQGTLVRRIAFTREQEESIRLELDNPARHLKNKAEIKVIYYIGMYTGQRLKDCVLMQWRNIDLRKKRIWVKQFKTGKEVSIPMAEPLRDVLEDALSWKREGNDYVCLYVAARYQEVDAKGKSVGDNYVNIDVLRVIRWIGLEPSIAVEGRKKKATVYGFHSLRHSFASHCAEAGVPKAVVVSILGANSEIIDRFYTHVGDDAQRAAIDAIIGSNSSGTSERERIREAVAYIEQLSDKTPELLRLLKILSK